MRKGFLLVTLLSLGSSAACGGSSSETPFPIEPNQAELRSGMLTRPHTLPAGRRADAGRPSSEEESTDENGEPLAAPDEASEPTRESERTVPDSNAPPGAASDAGAPAPGNAGLPTWGGTQAPKR